MKTSRKPVFFAILAAVLYGMSAPFSKILLKDLSPTYMAALLYIGAGIGMSIIYILTQKNANETNIQKQDSPYVLLMIILDIAAPILLMFGLLNATASTVSLLNNFEIVATSIIALAIFKEAIDKRLWLAILLILGGSIALSLDISTGIVLNKGAVFVILATLCWGIENNMTRQLSIRNPIQVVVYKGFGSGFGALLVTLLIGEPIQLSINALLALILGFFAFGLSIFTYIIAQRHLGSARTSSYYAFAPFIGAGLSMLILGEPLNQQFLIGLVFMCLGTYFLISERHGHEHVHERVKHSHKHYHDDDHHHHTHDTMDILQDYEAEHSHEHIHEVQVHTHEHRPDLHHRHNH